MCCTIFFLRLLRPSKSTPFPYTTLFRSVIPSRRTDSAASVVARHGPLRRAEPGQDRKSTRLNSSHTVISYAVFCLKKKSSIRDCNYCFHEVVTKSEAQQIAEGFDTDQVI